MDKYDLITMLHNCVDNELCETCPHKRKGQPGCGTIVDEMTYNTQRELLDLMTADVEREKQADEQHEKEIEQKDREILLIRKMLDKDTQVMGGMIPITDSMLDDDGMSGILHDIRQRVNDPASIVSYSETDTDGMRTVSLTISTDWTKAGDADE